MQMVKKRLTVILTLLWVLFFHTVELSLNSLRIWTKISEQQLDVQIIMQHCVLLQTTKITISRIGRVVQQLNHCLNHLQPIYLCLVQFPAPLLPIQCPTNAHPWMEQTMLQGFGSLPHMLSSWLEFQLPGFRLAQPCLLWTFREQTNKQKNILYVSFYHSNKMKNK